MSKFQDWCNDILSIVQAAANGEKIQCSADNKHTWFDMDDCEPCDPALRLDFGDYDYRVKPRTIRIGEYDVPEPMREAPQVGHYAYIADPVSYPLIGKIRWTGGGAAELNVLHSGLLHADSDSASIHSKALISLTSMEK